MVKILRCFDSILITKEDIRFLLIWLITPAFSGILLASGAICENMIMSIAGIVLFVIYTLCFVGTLLYEFFSKWWDNIDAPKNPGVSV